MGGAEWGEGIRGGGMYFNGVDSYVNLSNNHAFDLEYGITLAAWVAPMDLANGQDNEWIDNGNWFYPWFMMDETYNAVWGTIPKSSTASLKINLMK